MVLIVLSSVVALGTVVVALTEPQAFLPYFGSLNPFVALSIVLLLGLGLLPMLSSRAGFKVYSAGHWKGPLESAGLATIMAFVMIGVDIVAPFPADINVAFPTSLFFYPVMGYVVDIIFHVLPLTVLAFAGVFGNDVREARTRWISLGFIALLEPVYQVMPMASDGQHFTVVMACTGIHILIINLLQLRAFVRHDFLSMYTFRIVYYALWHVAWGAVRLKLLF